MSLIVDALKRAQEGATRRLPPFSGRGLIRPVASAGSDDHRFSGRVVIATGVAVVAIAATGAGLWMRYGRALSQPPPRLLVVEPLGSSAASSRPKDAGAAGTTVEEVRAALLAAQPLETNIAKPEEALPSPAQAPTPAPPVVKTAAPAPQPRPSAATGRSTPPVARLPVTPPPIVRPAVPAPGVVSRPAPPRDPPAVVSVHADAGAVATDALASGLKNQQLGQTAKAIDDYRRGVQADARNPGLFNNLGVALRDSGRLDEAIEAFQAALNIDPKYEKALNNLGVSRYQRGQYEQAIDLFQQSLRINPGNVESYINMGIIYFLAQRWDEALNAFQQALRNDPRSAEAHYNLGLLWERHGDREKAQQDYRKFVELAGPQHEALATRVSEHIRQMERSQ